MAIRFSFLSSLVRRIGVDLGTQTTRIWTDRDGVVLTQPSCIAVDLTTKKVMAVGDEALAMEGRVGSHIQVIHPLKEGAVFDAEQTKTMMRLFLHSVLKTPYFFRPIVMVAVPGSATVAQRQTITDVFYAVGASEVYTMSQPLAAAIGAGVPIADASGTFLMHFGYGVCEAAIISLGSIVNAQVSYQAGSTLIESIQRVAREQLNFDISQTMAQKLLEKVASCTLNAGRQWLVAGQDTGNGSPKEVTLTSAMVSDAVQKWLVEQTRLLKALLSEIPPELTVDVIDKGMLLTGGLSPLDGLEAALIDQLGVAVTVVEDPSMVVVKGLGVALENLELLKNSLGYQR